jgi:hypothetical protein
MMKLCFPGASLGLALLVGSLSAVAGQPAGAAKGLTNPLFPYCVNGTVTEGVLRELGYTPMRNLYVGVNLDKTPPYAPALKDQVRKLKGTDTIFWLCVLGRKDQDRDGQAVAVIRELAAVAEEVGLRVAIYPHHGHYTATAREALRVVKKVDRKNVGLTLNLVHELLGDQGPELPQIIEETAPYLFVVTVNGADRKEKGKPLGPGRRIQPLGQGSFDVYAFLKKVKAVGYRGPFGLQCVDLKGDPLVHLRQSIAAWKEYSARLAAEQ